MEITPDCGQERIPLEYLRRTLALELRLHKLANEIKA